jgi:CDP-diacylglycerol--glycerol-3-phosphate 3-phosphatidyltransferase
MANLITLARLLLLLIVVGLAYLPPGGWQFVGFVLVILIFVGDGLDGYVARKRNETTLFGALFDIAGDRIVELTLWIVAADLDLVPIWVVLVFVSRGVIVDTIRSSQSVAQEVAPFSTLHSKMGRFLVSSKFVRILYSAAKASAFSGLMMLRAFPVVLPTVWSYVGWLWSFLVEFLHTRKEDILGHRQLDETRNIRH